MKVILKKAIWTKAKSSKQREVFILSQEVYLRGKDYYRFLILSNGTIDDRPIEEFELMDTMKKTNTEVYPWEVFNPKERLDMDYINSISSVDELNLTKEELLEIVLKYNTALNRAEEIIKRSIGQPIDQNDHADTKTQVKGGLRSQLNSLDEIYAEEEPTMADSPWSNYPTPDEMIKKGFITIKKGK